MDPISALIGGAASLFGSFMNTSSQQAINAQNLAAQQGALQGDYLPGLVANAQRAGLSPLAVLGQHAPNMAVEVGTQPGQGMQDVGRMMAQVDPSIESMRSLQEERARIDIANARQLGNNAAIEGAKNMTLLEMIDKHRDDPNYHPSDLSERSLPGMGVDWLHKLLYPGAGADYDAYYRAVRPTGGPPAGSYNTP